jgi:hypothetical protein
MPFGGAHISLTPPATANRPISGTERAYRPPSSPPVQPVAAGLTERRFRAEQVAQIALERESGTPPRRGSAPDRQIATPTEDEPVPERAAVSRVSPSPMCRTWTIASAEASR